MNERAWLVSARFDLWVFLAPALVALGLVLAAPALSPEGELSMPMWLIAIVFVDVAHVWTTIYRTYLDPTELKRRPGLYTLTPLSLYAVGVIAYTSSPLGFWRALAYLAVWHFVRQQYGFLALYRRRAQETGAFDRWLDTATIYGVTIFPLLYWHAHLPRRFQWFLQGDFIADLVSPGLIQLLWPVYFGLMGTFVVRQVIRWSTERVFLPGKIVLVATTAACWGTGIIFTNSDYAFTLTNVLIHGVPYFAIVFLYGRRQSGPSSRFLHWLYSGAHVAVFIGLVWLLAFGEEYAWDRLIWHDHGALFPGPAIELGRRLEALLVPLLALPQATHYVLDAFIWKTARRDNPALATALRFE